MSVLCPFKLFLTLSLPRSHKKEASPSMQSRRWAAAGLVLRTWRRWRRSWMQTWTPPAARLVGSPPFRPRLLKCRANTRKAVRRPRHWRRCLRQARGGGAWRPRWASHHQGPKVPLLDLRRQVSYGEVEVDRTVTVCRTRLRLNHSILKKMAVQDNS